MKNILKTLGRIVIILALAGAVMGATVAITQASGFGGDAAMTGDRPEPPAGMEAGVRPEGGERVEHGGSGNPSHLIKNGLIIGLTVLVVAGGGWLIGRRSGKARRGSPPGVAFESETTTTPASPTA